MHSYFISNNHNYGYIENFDNYFECSVNILITMFKIMVVRKLQGFYFEKKIHKQLIDDKTIYIALIRSFRI